MTEFIIILVLIIFFGVFLSLAYHTDYHRNPKEFRQTLIGIPIGRLIVGIEFRDLNEQIRKLAVGEKKRKEK